MSKPIIPVLASHAAVACAASGRGHHHAVELYPPSRAAAVPADPPSWAASHTTTAGRPDPFPADVGCRRGGTGRRDPGGAGPARARRHLVRRRCRRGVVAAGERLHGRADRPVLALAEAAVRPARSVLS